MKKNVIQYLLLFTLFFNISHATLIALEDTCHHDSVHEYLLEQDNSNTCGDLCDLHHCFHFNALLALPSIYVTLKPKPTQFIQKISYHTPPFHELTIKPPIA